MVAAGGIPRLISLFANSGGGGGAISARTNAAICLAKLARKPSHKKVGVSLQFALTFTSSRNKADAFISFYTWPETPTKYRCDDLKLSDLTLSQGGLSGWRLCCFLVKHGFDSLLTREHHWLPVAPRIWRILPRINFFACQGAPVALGNAQRRASKSFIRRLGVSWAKTKCLMYHTWIE